jgi:signal transduction histidine kinase
VKKVFFIFFLLVGFSGFAQTLKVDSTQIFYSSLGHIYFVQDKQNRLSADHVLQDSSLKHLTKKEHIGGQVGPFWTRLTVQNISNKSLEFAVYNPLAGINKIDVYIYKENQLLQRHFLGDLRDQKEQALFSRYSSFKLSLKPGETFQIVSKIENYHVYNIGWHIEEINAFNKNSSYKITSLAFFAGIAILFSIFTLLLFINSKQYGYLLLALHSMMLIIYELGFHGVFYYMDIGLNLEFITAMTWLAPMFGTLAILLFPYFFFDMRLKYKKFAIAIYLFAILMILSIVLVLYALVIDPRFFQYYGIVSLVFLMTFTFLIIVGMFMLKQQEVGSLYYFLGHGILYLAMILNAMGMFDLLIGYKEILKYIVPMASIIESSFLLLAQYTKMQKIYQENEKQREMLLEQARFFSIGQAIGNVTHQWKKPLASLGSNITYLQAILSNRPEQLQEAFTSKLPNIQHSIDLMQRTIDDFTNYYAPRTTHTPFDPTQVLKKRVEAILKTKITLNNVVVEYKINSAIKLSICEYHFTNIMMILFDNSLDQFDQHQGSNNRIVVSIDETLDGYHIRYVDNGGGIEIEPIEKVFDYFVSSKSGSNQGMGLAIVKVLVDEKLFGKVEVQNYKDGVEFMIYIPKNGGG